MVYSVVGPFLSSQVGVKTEAGWLFARGGLFPGEGGKICKWVTVYPNPLADLALYIYSIENIGSGLQKISEVGYANPLPIFSIVEKCF